MTATKKKLRKHRSFVTHLLVKCQAQGRNRSQFYFIDVWHRVLFRNINENAKK